MSYFIIFDTEATTWEDAYQNGWTGENQYREIVQLSALKVSLETLEVLGEFNQLVKPKINPHLSNLFQQLTNITQEQVDKTGLSFPEAYNRFSEFCGHALVFSYGSDAFVLGENVALNHCHPRGALTMEGMGFVNIGPYIHRADPGSKQYNSGRLWQYFNLTKPHEADEHDALFDCYSILTAIRHLVSIGKNLPL